MLKKNIISNYLGQFVISLLGILLIPIYLKYLGLEAYGIIGFFNLLITWLTVLDLGVTPTISRSMANFLGGGHSNKFILELFKSFEIIYILLATIIILILFFSNRWLAYSWLNIENLPMNELLLSLRLMAIAIGLKFFEGIYRGALIGLQHQVYYNIANSILTTLRSFGALIVLKFVNNSLTSFFFWQSIISIITLIIFRYEIFILLPKINTRIKFTLKPLSSIWGFLKGMFGVTILALLLTQLDKILLSKLVPLKEFSYYSLTNTIAALLFIIVAPITQALYPKMVECLAQNNETLFTKLFHQGAQLVTSLTAPIASILLFYSYEVMFLWTGNSNIANSSKEVLSILSFSNFLNALLYMPYHSQIAYGWTQFSFYLYLIGIVFILPGILITAPLFGVIGPAYIWLTLNIVYIFIAIHFMYRKILRKEKFEWYLKDLFLPTFGAILPIVFSLLFRSYLGENRVHIFFYLLIIGLLSSLGSLIGSHHIKEIIIFYIKKYFKK